MLKPFHTDHSKAKITVHFKKKKKKEHHSINKTKNKYSLKSKKKKTHRLYENLRYTKDQGSRDLVELVFIDLKRRGKSARETERLKNLSEESLRNLLLPFCRVCVSNNRSDDSEENRERERE